MHINIHMKTRTTLMIDDFVLAKLRSRTGNLSAFVNGLLKDSLFGKREESMFGAFKGRISGKDKIEDDD